MISTPSIILYQKKVQIWTLFLYKKFGFKEIPNNDSPYNRGNIKMIVKL